MVNERDSKAEEASCSSAHAGELFCCISGVHTGLVERREWKVRVGAEGLIPALLPISPTWASKNLFLCLSLPSLPDDSDVMESAQWITLKHLKRMRSASCQCSFGSCCQIGFRFLIGRKSLPLTLMRISSGSHPVFHGSLVSWTGEEQEKAISRNQCLGIHPVHTHRDPARSGFHQATNSAFIVTPSWLHGGAS